MPFVAEMPMMRFEAETAMTSMASAFASSSPVEVDPEALADAR